MRENGFDTGTQLRDHQRHPLTSLLKSLGMNVCLRRNTTYIQTSASHLSVLEDYHLQALLGSVFSGAVTAWARADDNQICFFWHKNLF